MSRVDWGARTDLPRLGEVRPADEPTEIIQHHTVISDRDDTPLFWESPAEVIRGMQVLQTVRPDLGDDVPYSYVGFFMKYRHKSGLILCEGRGAFRRGAHTKYHNRTGRAMAIQGNTMGEDISEYVEMLGWAWGWIKETHGLVNLGSRRPPRAELFGHRDFRLEHDRTTWTVCPGDGAYAALPDIKIAAWQAEPEDDMKSITYLDTDGDFWLVRVTVPRGTPYSKRQYPNATVQGHLIEDFGEPKTVGEPGAFNQRQWDSIPAFG